MTIKNSDLFHLDDRSREIFKRIVEEYLAKGFPIGSRTVSQMDRINLSAASIRNVMHDLESLGLIYSPHTSSGRIPTEGGLRLFVDAMLEIGNLTDTDQAAMKEQAMTNNMTLEDALSKASEMLSGLTNCTGVVSVNKDVKYVKHIEFVSLDKTKILVILVDEDGKVENRIINNSEGITASSLASASNYLNHHMRGLTLSEAVKRIETDFIHKKNELDKETTDLLTQGLATWSNSNYNKDDKILIVKGASKLISNIEASDDLEKVRHLFQDLENKQEIMELLGMAEKAEGVRIFIGSENKLFSLSGSSMIVTPYKNEKKQVIGVLGVIGPTRMNYGKIIPMVNYTAELMKKILG
ncbi:MAG: heat-inducible transcriptional repressor HrcA [Rhodobiaceae bacterium]|nr:heat-inducible transcriptional repressor HrcA [Rhodobiaceae bacterium]MBS70649.1 heat-inducible transcriptional repressor HrcA [Rhodobiaceae bacterium]MEC8404049.1 heat-inducible transcriptional repressor HrcA [Pseudomonadota bacterium]MEC8426208.1 heat-inducible transcriptional repressor HrcA [Pseudomonadota bacterium]MEC8452467.1 heat-inducible transcriptional repressor HrcA [Pseudomonadota bacterium]|tara:strand:+ start:17970 stop:19031 length:1062 start_codon:yes stop_codon:yes gene_type:complete